MYTGNTMLQGFHVFVSGQEEFCVDLNGNRIAVGERYQPYIDEPCVECICGGLSRNGLDVQET